MPIEFACEACEKLLRVPDGSSGSQCQCPACGRLLEIPDPAAIADVDVHSGRDDETEKIKIPCPNCHFDLMCDLGLVGAKGQCRNCKYIFTISENPAVAGTTSEASRPGWVFTCPKCDQLFEGKKEMQGRKGKCHMCGEVFAIELKPAEGTSANLSTPKHVQTTPSALATSLRSSNPTTPKSAAAGRVQKSAVKQSARVEQTGSPAAQQAATALRISCSKCEGVMEVPAAAAGQTTACPYCQQLLLIPTSSHAANRSTVPQTPATTPLRASARQQPAASVWDELSDLSGYVHSPGAATVPGMDHSVWQPARRNVAGLTFVNAFNLAFQSLFPYSLVAAAMFACVTLVALISMLVAAFIGSLIFARLELEPASAGAYAAIYTPMGIVVLAMVFLSTAALCMTCNTALHVVRGKLPSGNVLFSTGGCYSGMLVIMLGWTGLNALRQFGVPYLVKSLIDSGQSETAFTVGVLAIVLSILIQVVLYFMLAFVPYAMIDGENLANAVGTSMSIFFGNFLTALGVIVCGWLLYLLVSIVTCGLGLFVFVGSMIYLNAAIYKLARK